MTDFGAGFNGAPDWTRGNSATFLIDFGRPPGDRIPTRFSFLSRSLLRSISRSFEGAPAPRTRTLFRPRSAPSARALARRRPLGLHPVAAPLFLPFPPSSARISRSTEGPARGRTDSVGLRSDALRPDGRARPDRFLGPLAAPSFVVRRRPFSDRFPAVFRPSDAPSARPDARLRSRLSYEERCRDCSETVVFSSIFTLSPKGYRGAFAARRRAPKAPRALRFDRWSAPSEDARTSTLPERPYIGSEVRFPHVGDARHGIVRRISYEVRLRSDAFGGAFRARSNDPVFGASSRVVARLRRGGERPFSRAPRPLFQAPLRSRFRDVSRRMFGGLRKDSGGTSKRPRPTPRRTRFVI